MGCNLHFYGKIYKNLIVATVAKIYLNLHILLQMINRWNLITTLLIIKHIRKISVILQNKILYINS